MTSRSNIQTLSDAPPHPTPPKLGQYCCPVPFLLTVGSVQACARVTEMISPAPADVLGCVSSVRAGSGCLRKLLRKPAAPVSRRRPSRCAQRDRLGRLAFIASAAPRAERRQWHRTRERYLPDLSPAPSRDGRVRYHRVLFGAGQPFRAAQ